MDKQPETAGVLVLVGAVILILLAVAFAISQMRKQRQAEALQIAQLAAREIAVIEEDIRSTTIGGISILMLVLTVVGSSFSYTYTKTVFQQIEVSVTMISSLILFGIGAALGRRRTYRIYRSEHREPM